MKQIVCYKPKRRLMSAYGSNIGSVLHKTILSRIERNKLIGIEERWFCFSIYEMNGRAILALSNI